MKDFPRLSLRHAGLDPLKYLPLLSWTASESCGWPSFILDENFDKPVREIHVASRVVTVPQGGVAGQGNGAHYLLYFPNFIRTHQQTMRMVDGRVSRESLWKTSILTCENLQGC